MSHLATHNPIIHSIRCLTIASLCAAVVFFASIGPSFAQQSTMTISSPSFANNAVIPQQYACTGADSSPPLKWSGAPTQTKALALIVEDPDAPGGTFIHWVAYNIPASKSGLESGIAQGEAMHDGGKQGVNSFKKMGYNGPCPPSGSPHHYHFRLFALDQTVNPATPVTASALEAAIRGHVKANAELVGIFQR